MEDKELSNPHKAQKGYFIGVIMVSLDEVLSHFKPLNHVVLATIDGEKPKLRPVTMVRHRDCFYFATGVTSNKVRQLMGNPEVEFIIQWKEEPNNGYIRVEGKAVREKASKTVAELYDEFEYFSKLWSGPDDPDLLVYRIEPKIYDYMKPGEWASVQVEAV